MKQKFQNFSKWLTQKNVIFKTANSQIFWSLGIVELIDAKGIDVAQPIWT
jgi:hypothetical protein